MPPPPFFTTILPDPTFQKHLQICINSDFTLRKDNDTQQITILDESNIVLAAMPIADAWLVNLSPAYYLHPLLEAR